MQGWIVKMDNIHLALAVLAAYFWALAFLNIKYMLSFTGAKYPLGILLIAVFVGITGADPFFKGTVEFLTVSFIFWVIYVIAKLVLKVMQNPYARAGWNSKNDLFGLFPQKGNQAFGGAKPSSALKAKKKTNPRDVETSTKSKYVEPRRREPQPEKNSPNSKQTSVFSNNFKTCSTCAFWAGEREINATRNVVRVPLNARGKCAGGGHNHAEVPAIATCSKFTKWNALT
jgi:hypothetical protein